MSTATLDQRAYELGVEEERKRILGIVHAQAHNSCSHNTLHALHEISSRVIEGYEPGAGEPGEDVTGIVLVPYRPLGSRYVEKIYIEGDPVSLGEFVTKLINASGSDGMKKNLVFSVNLETYTPRSITVDMKGNLIVNLDNF